MVIRSAKCGVDKPRTLKKRVLRPFSGCVAIILRFCVLVGLYVLKMAPFGVVHPVEWLRFMDSKPLWRYIVSLEACFLLYEAYILIINSLETAAYSSAPFP